MPVPAPLDRSIWANRTLICCRRFFHLVTSHQVDVGPLPEKLQTDDFSAHRGFRSYDSKPIAPNTKTSQDCTFVRWKEKVSNSPSVTKAFLPSSMICIASTGDAQPSLVNLNEAPRLWRVQRQDLIDVDLFLIIRHMLRIVANQSSTSKKECLKSVSHGPLIFKNIHFMLLKLVIKHPNQPTKSSNPSSWTLSAICSAIRPMSRSMSLTTYLPHSTQPATHTRLWLVGVEVPWDDPNLCRVLGCRMSSNNICKCFFLF